MSRFADHRCRTASLQLLGKAWFPFPSFHFHIVLAFRRSVMGVCLPTPRMLWANGVAVELWAAAVLVIVVSYSLSLRTLKHREAVVV
ncbi:unnamed protein product [Nezara viridula]|uniref:Uncharacterized protein n=1 Tax=Nezara viridula TaxID=85310 RepID=A0A9P0H9J1_NEZVI|nr:unnamed protein product [Nezara viridula]